MFETSLSRKLQDYLDAQIALAQRRGQSDDADNELREYAQAKQHLLDEVSGAYPRAAEPLMTTIREFLHAEAAFDRCPPGGGKWGHAAAQLDMARQALVEQIRGASGDAFVTRHPLPSCPVNRKRILVATDGSSQADCAVRVGGEMASELSATLVLLHVLAPESWLSRQSPSEQPSVAAIHQLEGVQLLSYAERLLVPTLESARMLRGGVPAEEIAAAARAWNADFIVMGKRGRGRVAQFVMGSTAEAVLRLAHCPVVVVGHERERAPGQTADWTGVGADSVEPFAAHAGAGKAFD